MKITVEYLIIFNNTDSFCDSVETFTKLLQVDSTLAIREGRIYHKDDFSCKFEITGDEITGKDQRYYHLRFTLDNVKLSADEEIERFTSFLKKIREVVGRSGGQVETLWDDIAFFYSQKSYPMIYEIENLMRKLIANFMLITIGKNWMSEASPVEIREAVNKSKRKDYVNVLHTIDFIDLANFLVKPYSKKTPQDVYTLIKKCNNIEELQEIKDLIPRSNWQRYFSKIVDCEDEYLSKRWQELYDLRCMVAHNAIINKVEYGRIIELVTDLRPKIQEAINKLPQVNIPRDERDSVAESVATNINTLYGDFITAWKMLEETVIDLLDEKPNRPMVARQAADILRRANNITIEQYKEVERLSRIRNDIVHSSRVQFTESELQIYISQLLNLSQSIESGKYKPEEANP